jgi:type I restriction enzyme R subunit
MQSPEELAPSAGSANQFQQFVTLDDGGKLTELYNVQHLQSAHLDCVSRVCISTIQRLYSMLRDFAFIF